MHEVQKHVKEFKKKVNEMHFEVETGTVKAVVNGEGSLIDLSIDTSMLEADEISILPELIKKAIQQAQKKAREELADKMGSIEGMPSIPGLEQFLK